MDRAGPPLAVRRPRPSPQTGAFRQKMDKQDRLCYNNTDYMLLLPCGGGGSAWEMHARAKRNHGGGV